MLEPANHIIDAAAWQRELIAIKQDILDAEPVAALARLEALRRELAESELAARQDRDMRKRRPC